MTDSILKVALMCAVIGFVLPGCKNSQAGSDEREQLDQDIQAILTQSSEADDYGESKNCLRGNEYRDFRVLNDRYVLFEGSHGRLWINRLFTPMPGTAARQRVADQVDHRDGPHLPDGHFSTG